MLKSSSLLRMVDPRVKQQYLEFMLVFASEFRNLPVHFGYRTASKSTTTTPLVSSSQEGGEADKTASPSSSSSSSSSSSTAAPVASHAAQKLFVTQKFFLRLEPQHPGNNWLRRHNDLFDLVDLSGSDETTPDGVSAEVSGYRERVHVYTSYHRVKQKSASDTAGGAIASRSAESVPTCYTYVFSAHELEHMDSREPDPVLSTASVLPDEVRWWRTVRTRVLDPLLPLHWNNNQPWLWALHSYTHGHTSHGTRADHDDASSSSVSSSSLSEMEKAVMDANNTLTFRARVQQRFFQNACLTPGEDEVKRALARGRLELRQLKEIAHVRKFRAMRKRYEWSTMRLDGHGSAAAASPEEQWWLGLENRDTYGYNELEAAVNAAEKSEKRP